MKTIKELAILFLIGMCGMYAMFLDLRTTLGMIPLAIMFAFGMKGVISFLYPENDLDDKIDLK